MDQPPLIIRLGGPLNRWRQPKVFMSGSMKLADANDWIEIVCSKCERHGRLRRDSLLRKYPGSTAMPDLLNLLAEPCPRLKSAFSDRCGARYAKQATAPGAASGP